MFFTYAQLLPSDIFKLRRLTVQYPTSLDNNRVKCVSYRFKNSSTGYWESREEEELEYEVLYRPDFYRDRPQDADSEE